MSLSAPTPDYLNPSGRKSNPERRARLRRAIFAFDVLILLAPPMHWFFSGGQSAFWYFLASNALVTLSLFALWKTIGTDEVTA
ncbi:hypothetical protein [Arthrobacter celericrescens]|uniref:hypothetical protein n=1 Tax=Arthrobacter celericrescens TaxID=2320851 RepID=UPI000EA3B076|nr:hypothetical protein [Arthrobacter celericrescens]